MIGWRTPRKGAWGDSGQGGLPGGEDILGPELLRHSIMGGKVSQVGGPARAKGLRREAVGVSRAQGGGPEKSREVGRS